MIIYLYFLYIPVVALCLYAVFTTRKMKARLDEIEKRHPLDNIRDNKPTVVERVIPTVVADSMIVKSIPPVLSVASPQPEIAHNEWTLKITVDDDETYTIEINWSDGSHDVVKGNSAKEVKILRNKDGSYPVHTVNTEKDHHLGTVFSWELNGFFWS